MAAALPPDRALVDRFAADLDRIAPPDGKLGVAVSGGPDSLALLLLACAARPGAIEAATVDHRLRPESAAEAAMVATLCERLAVPHSVLAANWRTTPAAAVQEQARHERYRLLAGWLCERRLTALVTAHHLDDQAETFLMRLRRGSGARGLAAMRPLSTIPGSDSRLLRPLLGWRRTELDAICAAAGVKPAQDPGNSDEQFERVRIRRALASADWLDPQAIARSAANLAQADAALAWAADRVWQEQVARDSTGIIFSAAAPLEIQRRIACRAIAELASEGVSNPLRGNELDRLLAVLAEGGRTTLRGVLCIGGETWRFVTAPKRA